MFRVRIFTHLQRAEFKALVERLSFNETKYDLWKPPSSYKKSRIEDRKKIYATVAWIENV